MIDIPAKSQHRLPSDFAADKIQTHITPGRILFLSFDVLQQAPPAGSIVDIRSLRRNAGLTYSH